MIFNKKMVHLNKSLIGPVLPASDYILIYPVIAESIYVFNLGYMAFIFCVLIFLYWGLFYIYYSEK